MNNIWYNKWFVFGFSLIKKERPPRLVDPQKVISHTQSEQFSRSFQPNVALAPPTKLNGNANHLNHHHITTTTTTTAAINNNNNHSNNNNNMTKPPVRYYCPLRQWSCDTPSCTVYRQHIAHVGCLWFKNGCITYRRVYR